MQDYSVSLYFKIKGHNLSNIEIIFKGITLLHLSRYLPQNCVVSLNNSISVVRKNDNLINLISRLKTYLDCST